MNENHYTAESTFVTMNKKNGCLKLIKDGNPELLLLMLCIATF